MRHPTPFRPDTNRISSNPFRTMPGHPSDSIDYFSHTSEDDSQPGATTDQVPPAAAPLPPRPVAAGPSRSGALVREPPPPRRLSAPYRGPEAAPIAEPATRGEATPPITLLDEAGDTRINPGALGALLDGTLTNPFHRGSPSAIHTGWDLEALADALRPAGPTHGLGRLMADRLAAEGIDISSLDLDDPRFDEVNAPEDVVPDADADADVGADVGAGAGDPGAKPADAALATPVSGSPEPAPDDGLGPDSNAEPIPASSEGVSRAKSPVSHEWANWASSPYGSEAERSGILDGLRTLVDLDPEAAEARIDDLLPGRYQLKAELMKRLRKPPAERNAAEQHNAISAIAKVGHLVQADREVDGVLAENRQIFAALERDSNVTVTLQIEPPVADSSADATDRTHTDPAQVNSDPAAEPIQNHVFNIRDPEGPADAPDRTVSIYLPADVAMRVGRDPDNAERGLGHLMVLERLASDPDTLERWLQENETVVVHQGRGARSHPGTGRKTGISDVGKAMRAAARPMANAQLMYDFARALVESDDTPAHRALLMAARDQRDAVMRVLAPTLFPKSYDDEALLRTVVEWAPITGQAMALIDAGENVAAAWESAERGDVAGTALHLGLVLLDGIGTIPAVGTAIKKAGKAAIDVLPENASQAVKQVHTQYQLARAANRSAPDVRAQQPSVDVLDMFGDAYTSLPAPMQTRIRGIYTNILGQVGELTGNDRLRAGGFEVLEHETSKSTRKNPKTTTQTRKKTEMGVRIYDAETAEGIERASLLLFIPLLRPSFSKTKGALWDMKVGRGNMSETAEAKDNLVRQTSIETSNNKNDIGVTPNDGNSKTPHSESDNLNPDGVSNGTQTGDINDVHTKRDSDKEYSTNTAGSSNDPVDIQYLTWKTSELDSEHLRKVTKRLVYSKIGSDETRDLTKVQADALVEAVMTWHAGQVARSNRPILIADLVIYTASAIERQQGAQTDDDPSRAESVH